MSSLLGLDDKLHGLYDELKISGNIFQGLDDKLVGLDTKLLAYCMYKPLYIIINSRHKS